MLTQAKFTEKIINEKVKTIDLKTRALTAKS